MLTIPVFNTAGEQVGQETIDPADFGGAINKQLLHDVVLMHLAARRVGTVNTRGRADVAGSGKKLFRQKGTGNARVGAKRTNSARVAARPSPGATAITATPCPKRLSGPRSGWHCSPSFRTTRPWSWTD